MPELPEVETIRRNLATDITGKIIKNVEILTAKQFIGDDKIIIGHKIIAVSRTGKIISLKFSDTLYLSIHLKLTGQLLFAKNKKQAVFHHRIPFVKTDRLPAKTTRITINLSDGSALFFNDLRKFGWMKVTDKPEKPAGIDVLSKDFTSELVNSFTRKTAKPIKLLLMEQNNIAGIGNIYANDALFVAGILPTRPAKTLKDAETKKLYQAIKQVINEGLKYDGSSDDAYILPDASEGHYQEHFKVYQKEGLPCPNKCGGKIIRIKQGGRSSFFCPKCQK